MSCSNCGTSTCGGCHSCNSCGSSACTGTCGCNCGGIPAGCNTAVCPQTASCGTVLPASPLPYYVQSSQCQEDHCQQIIKNWYSAAICINYAFNMPACGNTAVVYFSDLKKLVINSYLWHPTYGYLKVVAFDFQTGQVTLLNECEDGNAAPGTSIPACTCFIATPAPIDVAQIGASCVAVDFTAPAVGACLDITVTNVNNLSVPGLVAIGSGIYTLAAIVSSTIINICNDGLGITPGTPVIALDANGDYQYCLSSVGTNPCTEDPVDEGAVVVCSEGGLARLGGATVGHVLTLTNAGSELAQFKTLDLDSDFDLDSSSVTAGPANLALGGTATKTVTLTIANASASRNMLAMVNIAMVAQISANLGDPGDIAGCTVQFTESINGAPAGNIFVTELQSIVQASLDIRLLTIPYFKSYTVAPSSNLTLVFVTRITGAGTKGCSYTNFFAFGNLSGVAV